MEEGKIVYLDPMEVELDECNIRYDFPADEEVINEIYQDLVRGKGIEYHITVRVKNRKYYCYIGRNRLLAAKKYVRETGNKIKIPAKIMNVDDLEAMSLSLQENLKRKNLTPTEESEALRKLYEMWVERKREKILQMSKVGPEVPLLTNIKDNLQMSKMEYYEYDPQDPRNPFSIPKFIEENNIPLSKKEVERLLALDRLPDQVKRWVDEFIDTHTAYELSKFDDEQTIINYANALLGLKNVPQSIKVDTVKKCREEGGDVAKEAINRYKEYLFSKYTVFEKLNDDLIKYMANNISGPKLPRLSEKLEVLAENGLKFDEVDLITLDGIVDMSKRDLENFIEFYKDFSQEYSQKYPVDINYLLERYIQEKDIKRLKARLENEFKKKEEWLENARREVEYAYKMYNHITGFLDYNVEDKCSEIEEVIKHGYSDKKYINRLLLGIYNYIFMSPGWSRKEIGERRRTVEGVLWRFYGKEYAAAEDMVEKGLESMNREYVVNGLNRIISILKDINEILDHDFHMELSRRLERLKNEYINFNPNDQEVLEDCDKLVKYMEKIWQHLEIYLYIRKYIQYIGSDEVVRMSRIEEIGRLERLYGILLLKLDKYEPSAIEEYVNNIRRNDEYQKIRKFFTAYREVENMLSNLEGIAKEDMDAAFMFIEFKQEFEEVRRLADTREMELLRDRVRENLEKVSKPIEIPIDVMGNTLHIMLRRNDDKIDADIMPKQFTSEKEEELEHDGEIYKITYEIEGRVRVKKVSHCDS